jgi:WD40 repeat protein
VLGLMALAAAPPPPPRPTLTLRPSSADVYFARFALSSDGRLLAVLTSENPIPGPAVTMLELWDVRTGRRQFRGVQWRPHRSPTGLAFLPGGQQVVYLYGGLDDKHLDVRVVAADTGRVRAEYALPPGRGHVYAVSPDGKLLAVGGPGFLVALHDLWTGKEVARFTGPERMPEPVVFGKGDIAGRTENQASSLAFSPDGKRLAVGTCGGWVSVWDLDRRKRKWREPSKKSRSEVSALAFSPDGSALAYSERAVFVRDVRTGRLLSPQKGIVGTHVCYVDSRTLALWTWEARDGRYARDAASFRPLAAGWEVPTDRDGLPVIDADFTGAAFSADGSTFAGRLNGGVEVWDLRRLYRR